MEFAGKDIPQTSEELADSLLARFSRVYELRDTERREWVKAFWRNIKELAVADPDSIVAYVLKMIEQFDTTTLEEAEIMGGVAARCSMYIRENDPEIGDRLIHSVLTAGRKEALDGAEVQITKAYEQGKIPYDTYSKFYIILNLQNS